MSGSTRRLLVLTALVFCVLSALSPDKFLSPANFESMAFLFPELALLSFAMLSGGIDLSIVSTANLSGICAALILTRTIPEQPSSTAIVGTIALAVGASLGCGLVCGAFNGLLISRVGISPILATLGTMQLYVGVALIVTRGSAVLGFPEPFLELGNGTVHGVPAPFLVFLIAAGLIWVLSSRTVFGIHLRLLGTNPVAARFSGIRVRSVLFRTYAATGVIAGATGVLLIARTNSAKADYGSGYLLQSILVVVLGGVNPAGGFGTVFGVSVAVVALQLLASGLNMLHCSHFARDFIWGLFLLTVLVVGGLRRKDRGTASAPADVDEG